MQSETSSSTPVGVPAMPSPPPKNMTFPIGTKSFPLRLAVRCQHAIHPALVDYSNPRCPRCAMQRHLGRTYDYWDDMWIESEKKDGYVQGSKVFKKAFKGYVSKDQKEEWRKRRAAVRQYNLENNSNKRKRSISDDGYGSDETTDEESGTVEANRPPRLFESYTASKAALETHKMSTDDLFVLEETWDCLNLDAAHASLPPPWHEYSAKASLLEYREYMQEVRYTPFDTTADYNQLPHGLTIEEEREADRKKRRCLGVGEHRRTVSFQEHASVVGLEVFEKSPVVDAGTSKNSRTPAMIKQPTIRHIPLWDGPYRSRNEYCRPGREYQRGLWSSHKGFEKVETSWVNPYKSISLPQEPVPSDFRVGVEETATIDPSPAPKTSKRKRGYSDDDQENASKPRAKKAKKAKIGPKKKRKVLQPSSKGNPDSKLDPTVAEATLTASSTAREARAAKRLDRCVLVGPDSW